MSGPAADALHAEWIKARTLASTGWLLWRPWLDGVGQQHPVKGHVRID
jgi:hypothetical protein